MKATAEPLRIGALGPSLTPEQARRIYRQGEEAVVFTLLTLAKQVGGVPCISPSTPSAMVPTYRKPSSHSRSQRPGRKVGHRGARRAAPARIDQRRTHRLENCPACGGPLQRCAQTRTRHTEDIPQDITPVVTEHTIHRDWCPRCRRHVEPVVPEALPKATLANRVLVLSAWLHYGLGNALAQIVEIFNPSLPRVGPAWMFVWKS